MPLECCQMLSIVASDKWGHGFGTLPKADGNPYATEKGAFRNHPCTKWANDYVLNWRWLIRHGLACVKSIRIDTKRSIPVLLHYHMQTKFSHLEIPQVDLEKTLNPLFALCQMSLNLTQASTLLLLTKCTLHKPWVASNYLRDPSRKRLGLSHETYFIYFKRMSTLPPR